MNQKVGILGGAFNPPHQAHILLGEYALNHFSLDRLVYIPTHIPSHKKIEEGWNGSIRSLMIKLALFCITPEETGTELKKIIPPDRKSNKFISLYEALYQKNHRENITVSDIEIESDKISYTIDTVKKLLANNPGWEITIIIGMDQAAVLDSWKNYDELIEIANFCAADRADFDGGSIKNKFPFIEFFPFPKIVISSSMIRQRLKDGRSIRGLVPPIVEEFIALLS